HRTPPVSDGDPGGSKSKDGRSRTSDHVLPGAGILRAPGRAGAGGAPGAAGDAGGEPGAETGGDAEAGGVPPPAGVALRHPSIMRSADFRTSSSRRLVRMVNDSMRSSSAAVPAVRYFQSPGSGARSVTVK